jgi:uncharacterized protein
MMVLVFHKIGMQTILYEQRIDHKIGNFDSSISAFHVLSYPVTSPFSPMRAAAMGNQHSLSVAGPQIKMERPVSKIYREVNYAYSMSS